MTEGVLAGCRILVAEDDYLLASDTARLLRQAGGTIVGPVATLSEVQEWVLNDGFDVAVLDIRLDGEVVYPVADKVRQSGAQFAFLSGYDDAAIPARFADIPRCPKPCADEMLIAMVRGLHAG